MSDRTANRSRDLAPMSGSAHMGGRSKGSCESLAIIVPWARFFTGPFGEITAVLKKYPMIST